VAKRKGATGARPAPTRVKDSKEIRVLRDLLLKKVKQTAGGGCVRGTLGLGQSSLRDVFQLKGSPPAVCFG
jgi:hypothetical protein